MKTGAMRRVRASVVCVDAGEVLCVRMRDPVSGIARLFPPGGGIEPGEEPAGCAAREALEETGYEVVVEPETERVERYPFRWADNDIDVTTHFFAAHLTGSRDDHGVIEPDAIQLAVEWIPIVDLDRELGYDATIRAAVRALATCT